MTPSFMLAFFKYYFPSIVNMSETTICTVYRIYLYLIYVKEASNLQEEQPRIFEENKFFNLIAFLNLQQFVVPKKKKVKTVFQLDGIFKPCISKKKKKLQLFQLDSILKHFQTGVQHCGVLKHCTSKKKQQKKLAKIGLQHDGILKPCPICTR